MIEELKAIIGEAYAKAREVMQAKKGTWTKHGRKANMAFRALEVACKKLGIDTPPIYKIPESTKQTFDYQPVKQQPYIVTTTGDFISQGDEASITPERTTKAKSK